MFILKRHSSYFKAHTGKIYPANTFTLQFSDPVLEAQYVNSMAFKSFAMFRLVSFIFPFWAAIVVGFRYFTDAWTGWCYFIPITAGTYAPWSVLIAARMLKYRRYRRCGLKLA